MAAVFMWSCSVSPTVPSSTLVGDWMATAHKWETMELRLREENGRVIGTACRYEAAYNTLKFTNAPVVAERSGRVSLKITEESVEPCCSYHIGAQFIGKPEGDFIVGTFVGADNSEWSFRRGGTGTCANAKRL
jgi:hypothetical protein